MSKNEEGAYEAALRIFEERCLGIMKEVSRKSRSGGPANTGLDSWSLEDRTWRDTALAELAVLKKRRDDAK